MAGRKSRYQEFLRTLKSLTGTNVSQLAKLIGKQQPNVSSYLSSKPPDKRAMQSALRHISEWSVLEDVTMLPIAKRATVCQHPGIFFIYDSAGNCVYIGQASNLRTEVGARLTTKRMRHGIWRDPKLKLTRYPILAVAAFVTTFRVDSPRLRHNLEALFLVTVINQTQNAKKGKFK
jgi:predicted transcriptional regulator